jgi:EmrB/QacA subfamily drug resistance transporter
MSETHLHAPGRALVVVTMMFAVTSTILSSTIVNVALPAMMREFAVGHDTLQWVSTGFLAATTATMLATAWCIESFGERGTLLLALSLFTLASIAGLLSVNATMLIGARVLQGAGAGVMQPLAMVALFRVFPPSERGRAMSLFGLGIVLAPAIGPALGGVLVDAFGWRSVFLVPLPFCLLAMPFGFRALPRNAHATPRGFDYPGALLLIPALAALFNVPVLGHRSGWLAWQTLVAAALGALLAYAFIHRELRTPHPLLDVRLFRSRSFVGAALVSLAYGVGVFGSTYLVPVLVQEVAHFSASRAGLLLLIPGIALGIAIVFGGRLSDVIGPRPIIIGALVMFALSSFLLTFAAPETGFWTLGAWLAIGRIGLGLMIPALNVAALQPFKGIEIAQASGAVNFVRMLGAAIGVNLLAILLEWRLDVYGPGAPAAFHECFAVVTLAFLIATIPASWTGKSGR